MCPHPVDDMGYPVDPEIRRLEFRLCELAGSWRSQWGDPTQQEELVRDYAATMAKLYSMGWDGLLDIECELPDELMPEAYLKRWKRRPR